MSDELPRYYTVPEVAALLDCSPRYVLDELRRKNLRGIKYSAGWRITPADLQVYEDAHANVSKVRKAS